MLKCLQAVLHRPVTGRILSLACWLLPSIFCLWLYWYGLQAWFMEDDFAWLGVNVPIHDWNSFWHMVFVPSQQGTIRPLSERLFFIAFWHMFGWDAFYYRVFVLLTQLLNVALLSYVVWKSARSRVAQMFAPVLWIANAALTVPMSWTSGFNEVLCATCLLGAFALLLKFQETGNWNYYWLQVAVFLVGFGALELNIVYPAVALCWAFSVCSRKLALSTVPLFAISAIYYAVHAYAAPRQASGPYAMHFDGAIPATLWTYFHWAFVSPLWVNTTQLDPGLGVAAFCILAPVLLGFTIYEAWRGRYLPGFFFAWFFITIAPLAPLRDHLSDYYVAIPSLGLAVVASLAIASAWRGSAWRAATSVALAAIYLAVQIPVARAATLRRYDGSLAVRNLVLGVARAHQVHPETTILLTDVSPDLFATAVAHQPFRLIPDARVYLGPEALSAIGGLPENVARVSEFVLPRGATAHALAAKQLQVYSAAGKRLRNVTDAYENSVPRLWSSEYPLTVDAGNPFLAYTLGPSWYAGEGAYRWMPADATVRMGGPPAPGERLYLHAYCPKQLIANGPAVVTVSIDGREAGHAVINQADAPLDPSFDLPASATGHTEIEVEIHVDRTFRENGGGRTLAIAFGTLEIR